MDEPKLSDFRVDYANALGAIVLCMVALVTPQVVLRPVAGEVVGLGIFAPVFGGVIVFAVTILVLHQQNVVLGNLSSHQLVGKYLGLKSGLLLGAARILAWSMLILLGVEFMVVVAQEFFMVTEYKSLVSTALVVFLGICALPKRPEWVYRLFWVVVYAAIAVVTVSLIYLLIREAFDPVALLVPAKEVAAGSDVWRLYESFLVSCLPAATALVISERALAQADLRRVPLRRNIPLFAPVFIVFLLTLYLATKVLRPYVVDTVPILELSKVLLPYPIVIIDGVALVSLGLCLVLGSFWQIPQILRALALDGLLPRKLGVLDQRGPRQFIVVLIFITSGFATYFINSARFIVVIFILAAFIMAVLMCLAMLARSRSILRNSFSATTRKAAKNLALLYSIYSLVIIALVLSFFLFSLQYAAWTAALMIGPLLFLAIYNKGRGRVNKAIAIDDFLEHRDPPTKVHGVVLLSILNEASLQAVDWAQAMRFASVQAICVDFDPERTARLHEDWVKAKIRMPLTVLGTPVGALRGPVIQFVRDFHKLHKHEPLVVVIPRLIGASELAKFTSRFTEPKIIAELREEPGVMLLEVPYVLDFNSETLESDGEDLTERN
ncbi:MAG: hypothetical protein SPG61_05405 [Arcanobacterium sp.]|nr:hypothetical protein [Arcanobacterium sp.]